MIINLKFPHFLNYQNRFVCSGYGANHSKFGDGQNLQQNNAQNSINKDNMNLQYQKNPEFLIPLKFFWHSMVFLLLIFVFGAFLVINYESVEKFMSLNQFVCWISLLTTLLFTTYIVSRNIIWFPDLLSAFIRELLCVLIFINILIFTKVFEFDEELLQRTAISFLIIFTLINCVFYLLN